MKKFFGFILLRQIPESSVARSFIILAVFILPAAVNAAGMLERDLTVGSRGEEVKELQEFMAKDSALYPEGIISGYFGVLTKAAVRRFQEREGINPALGYVGPKTRARINVLGLSAGADGAKSQATPQIQSLLSQVKELERQIAALREAKAEPSPAATSTAAATTTPAVEPEPQPPSPPTVSHSIILSGGDTKRFAESVKLGDITLTNDSTSTVVLYQLTAKMEEAMNAPNSRGATFKLLLRNGTTTYDTLLSSRDVAIRSRVADPGNYNIQLVYPYAGISLSPGESKTLSFWVELLIGPFYGGELKFIVTAVSSSNPELPVTGTVTLILREP